jgi:AcrR family transcriptional regulator
MQDALIGLLQAKPLRSITVRELCKIADVNRSTFYAHYDNLNELLQEVEDTTITWVHSALDAAFAQTEQAGLEGILVEICQYIADNRNHLQVLMSPQADPRFQEELLRLIYSHAATDQQGEVLGTNPEEAEMRMRFAVSGSIGLLQYWLATNLTASVETVADIIFTMAVPQRM